MISSFDPRLWPPSRPQPDESQLMEDELGLIAMARGRYEELSDREKKLDLSHLWASEDALRPAGMALEAAGRGADDRLVHAATGEMVVPRSLLTNDPWLRSYLARVFKSAGLDWRTHVVGGPNRINPKTGLAEFDPGRDEADGIGNGDGFSGSDGSGNSGGGEGGRIDVSPDAGFHPDLHGAKPSANVRGGSGYDVLSGGAGSDNFLSQIGAPLARSGHLNPATELLDNPNPSIVRNALWEGHINPAPASSSTLKKPKTCFRNTKSDWEYAL